MAHNPYMNILYMSMCIAITAMYGAATAVYSSDQQQDITDSLEKGLLSVETGWCSSRVWHNIFRRGGLEMA